MRAVSAVPFLCVLALGLVPQASRAVELHLLDEPALSLQLPGIAGDSGDSADSGDSPLQLGLARPSAGGLQALVGCAASYFFPGLGQILLGRVGRGLLIMAVEVVLLMGGVALAFASGGFLSGFASPATVVGFAMMGLGGLVHIGGMVDATLLGLRTDRFGG